MNTKGFSTQKTIEANYLTIAFDDDAQFDEISLKAITLENPDFLIPFTASETNGVVTLKYKLKNLMALEYAADYSSQKADFIKLYKGLVRPMLEGKDWFLDYHYLCIDPQYVYVDRESGKAYYIYVPEKSYANSDEEILRYLKSIFEKTTIVDDPSFQVQMYKYFGGTDITLSSLYELIKKEESKGRGSAGNRVPEYRQPEPQGQPAPASQPFNNTPVTPPVQNNSTPAAQGNNSPAAKSSGLSGFFSKPPKEEKKEEPKPQKKEESTPSPKISTSNDDILSLLGGKPKKEDKKDKEKDKDKDKDKGSLFGSLFGKKKDKEVPNITPANNNPSGNQQNQQNVAPQNQFSGNYNGNMGFADMGKGFGTGDKTETFDDVDAFVEASLTLVSSPISGAIPKISLAFDKPYITIGRQSSSEPVQPDVAFSPDFRRIGRRHARIDKRDGEYYLIDLGSKNKTLYNGQELVANSPVKLVNGAEITFTDSMPVVYRVNL